MSLTMGPNTGLLINGAPGEGHYSELIRMLRWDDFLRQPVVKGRVATLPTTGQAEGDTYIFTGSGASQNRLARWWVVGATAGTWEYLTPKLGWRVQVANEATPAGQVKTYEFGPVAGLSWWAEWPTRRATAATTRATMGRGASLGPLPGQISTACRFSI
ncbi:DUF2793 domain-containing protein [Pseudomonas aeruginosa]